MNDDRKHYGRTREQMALDAERNALAVSFFPNLMRVLGTEGALDAWQAACKEVGASEVPVEVTNAELERIADYLIEAGGLASIPARSVKIQLLMVEELGEGDDGGGTK